MNDLKSVYLHKLELMQDVEDQIIATLPKLIDMATEPTLKEGLTKHLEETRAQRGRLDEVFAAHGATSSGAHDKAFRTMLEESDKELAEITDPNVRDAVIIAACQGVEHFEIARYGTLVEWAKVLDDKDGEKLLKDTLDEEENADKVLSTAAKGTLLKNSVNEAAADA